MIQNVKYIIIFLANSWIKLLIIGTLIAYNIYYREKELPFAELCS